MIGQHSFGSIQMAIGQDYVNGTVTVSVTVNCVADQCLECLVT